MDSIAKEYLESHDIDAVAVGVIDFLNKDLLTREYKKNVDGKVYFDLASLTKVLTNSNFYLSNINEMNEDLKLLIEHRAGLPAWGLLSKSFWRKEVCRFEIKKSETLYSDYSAIRFMLESEKTLKKNFRVEVFNNLDKEIKFWRDLDLMDVTLQNGYEKGSENYSVVHDPNARNIEDFVSHAGLFGTINGVCKSLIKMNENLKLLKIMVSEKYENRFVLGWDTAENLETTTAGKGCSSKTFGHLGFTGNSIWIDPQKNKGLVILTNTTKKYWYERKDLNQFRRKLGEILWKENHSSLESYFY